MVRLDFNRTVPNLRLIIGIVESCSHPALSDQAFLRARCPTQKLVQMMNHHGRTPSGPKKRTDNGDEGQPGVLPALFSRHLRNPETSKQSAVSHLAYDSQLSESSDPAPLPPIQTQVSFEAVLTQISAPLQAHHPGRALPYSSTERSTVFTLPPLTLSPPKSDSFTSHSDISQSETWSDEPNLQSLQRENADLISAYSQAQKRIAELDATLQASSAEVAKLFKERQGLKAKIEILDAEVEELQSNAEQSQQHTFAKDAQYSQILEFSTRLQTQALSDSQQRKLDYEKWEHERQAMLQTITNLRAEVRTLRKSYGSVAHVQLQNAEGGPSHPLGTHDSSTSNNLEAEAQVLREANTVMQNTLNKVRQEHIQLSDYIEKLEGIGRNMERHLQASQIVVDTPRDPELARGHSWQGR